MEDLHLEPAEPHGIAAEEITADFAAALGAAVGAVVLDGETVVLDPATGTPYLLDGPATLVLQCLDGTSSLRDIAADIADVLELDPETVGNDVVELARSLGSVGLLRDVVRTTVAADHGVPTGLPEGTDLAGWTGWPEPAGEQTLVVNWGTQCGFCTMIGEELAALAGPLAEHGTELLLVTTGTPEALRAQLGELALPAQHLESPPDFFGATGTPAAYVVDRRRVTTESLAVGAYDVPDLARRLAGLPATDLEEIR